MRLLRHSIAIAEQSTSAYPSIKPSDLENLEIEIPDLDTQKKIADVLNSLDRKITQNIDVKQKKTVYLGAVLRNFLRAEWFLSSGQTIILVLFEC